MAEPTGDGLREARRKIERLLNASADGTLRTLLRVAIMVLEEAGTHCDRKAMAESEDANG